MIFEHYSAGPLGEITPAAQSENPDMKPNGLWVSVPGNDDWPSWCRSEEYALDRLAYRTCFKLAADANVLLLASEREIEEFHNTFAPRGEMLHPSFSVMTIRWKTVAERYDGIVIAPYQYGMRFDRNARWYYGWDCASGCIWNPAALVRLL